MTGDPCVVMFDEFQELLKREAFAAEIVPLAREIRKHNGVMVLATQSPADMTEELAAVIVDQCKNIILTPNPNASDPNQTRFYRQLGCTDAQIDAIASGHQKSDYLIRSPQWTNKIAIRLEDEAKAICGQTKPTDIKRCSDLLAEGVESGEAFLARWMAKDGLEVVQGEQAA
jgi:type IV secretion system protein VirB4